MSSSSVPTSTKATVGYALVIFVVVALRATIVTLADVGKPVRLTLVVCDLIDLLASFNGYYGNTMLQAYRAQHGLI